MNKRERPWIVFGIITVLYLAVLFWLVHDRQSWFTQCQSMYNECEIVCPDDEENCDG